MKILAVDDNPDNLELLFQILEEDYEVITALDGADCIATAKKELPDLILLDIMMPGMNGYEVLKKLRQDKRTQDIFVIFLTARFKDVDRIIKGLEMGAFDYLTKPIDSDHLLAKVRVAARVRAAEERLLKQQDELNREIACRRKAEKSVQDAHDKLEIRVQERTASLHSANEELKNEITVRRQAQMDLEKAIAEIEALKNRVEAENVYLQSTIKLEQDYSDMIGGSPVFNKVLSQVEQVAPTDSTVLILGETGVGKEILATALHGQSSRKHRTMVKVNCAALPATLIESELFGREKGAFTGAMNRQVGRFEIADKSTIFLDEIGELPLELQSKLLRVLQEGEFERLGSSETTRVDVRVIASTNRDLEKAVANGTFREDLYFRLNVFPIRVPPLRQRSEDIPPLIWHFVQKFGDRMGKIVDQIAQNDMTRLIRYSWPGNIRELQNIVERSMIITKDSKLCVELPQSAEITTKALALSDVERKHILDVLESTGWRIKGSAAAAEILGINPSTLRSRMKRLGISRTAAKGDIST